MRLAKIQVSNFRCFAFFDLVLEPDLTIIVGANGSGKSAILDAVAIALYELVAANGGGRTRERERKLQKAALLPTDIHLKPDEVETVAARESVVSFTAHATGFYPLEGFPALSETGVPSIIEWMEYIVYQPPAKFIYDTSKAERVSRVHRYFEELWRQIRTSPRALIPLPVVAYYRAQRRLGGMPPLGDVFSAELSRSQAFEGALDAGADFRAMCQWFYIRENEELRAQAADRGNPEFGDLRAAREAVTHALPGVERVFFSGSPPRLKVRLRDGGGEEHDFELASLSDGYRNLFGLVFDFARRLAQANPNWPKPLEAPGILIIDELELHLHPCWQQEVLPNLRATFPNTQIIASTHSPAVITTVRREQLRLIGSDHQLEGIAADVGTFGAESSRVLAEVFGAHSRPPAIESVSKLSEYLGLVEARQHDTEHALQLRANLERDLGRSDPDLRRADLRIAQLKAFGKR